MNLGGGGGRVIITLKINFFNLILLFLVKKRGGARVVFFSTYFYRFSIYSTFGKSYIASYSDGWSYRSTFNVLIGICTEMGLIILSLREANQDGLSELSRFLESFKCVAFVGREHINRTPRET